MQIPQINFNLTNTNFTPQKILSKQIFSKVNFRAQSNDTFTKSSRFSNEDAIKLLKTELQRYMTPKESDIYMKKIIGMCKELEIEPKNLPINEEHRGNLKDYQRQQMSFLVKEDIFSA